MPRGSIIQASPGGPLKLTLAAVSGWQESGTAVELWLDTQCSTAQGFSTLPSTDWCPSFIIQLLAAVVTMEQKKKASLAYNAIDAILIYQAGEGYS